LRTGIADIDCANTIHRIFGFIGPRSLDRDVAIFVARDAGEKRQQVIWACSSIPAVVGRQPQHLGAGDAGGDRLRLRVHHLGVRFYRDFFRRASHCQLHIGAHSLPRVKADVRQNRIFETGGCRRNCVKPGLHVFRLVIPLGVAAHFTRDIFALVGDLDRRVGYDRARCVRHRAKNGSEDGLRETRRGQAHDDQDNPKGSDNRLEFHGSLRREIGIHRHRRNETGYILVETREEYARCERTVKTIKCGLSVAHDMSG